MSVLSCAQDTLQHNAQGGSQVRDRSSPHTFFCNFENVFISGCTMSSLWHAGSSCGK